MRLLTSGLAPNNLISKPQSVRVEALNYARWPFQKRILDRIGGDTLILGMPTGLGKTYQAGKYLRRESAQRPLHVLFLTLSIPPGGSANHLHPADAQRGLKRPGEVRVRRHRHLSPDGHRPWRAPLRCQEMSQVERLPPQQFLHPIQESFSIPNSSHGLFLGYEPLLILGCILYPKEPTQLSSLGG